MYHLRTSQNLWNLSENQNGIMFPIWVIIAMLDFFWVKFSQIFPGDFPGAKISSESLTKFCGICQRIRMEKCSQFGWSSQCSTSSGSNSPKFDQRLSQEPRYHLRASQSPVQYSSWGSFYDSERPQWAEQVQKLVLLFEFRCTHSHWKWLEFS
jgi:hypothetical protein